jgi:hypothetical protein
VFDPDNWKLAQSGDLDDNAGDMLRDVIRAYHPALENHDLALLFKPKRSLSLGQEVLARAGLTTLREKLLGDDVEAVITVAWDWWEGASAASREALLDHELSHFGVNDEGELCLVGHDVQEFTAVWRRRGNWTEGLRHAAEVLQMQLPGLALIPTEGGDIESVTLSSGGKSVTLTAESGRGLRDMAAATQKRSHHKKAE